MKMFLKSEWVGRDSRIDVVNPYDGEAFDTVPEATTADVTAAVDGLVEGVRVMRAMPAMQRCEILRQAAALMRERVDDLGTIISTEEGKILAEGKLEVARAAETIDLSADEARRITGEVLPLDAAPGGVGKLGFTLRVPVGIVAAITPFNFPLNLVAHKVGPAIAGGNAVLIKPATDTPLSALKLVEVLIEAGLPKEAIACITGPGGSIGRAICEEDRIRKISFTGSAEVGKVICGAAGLKRVTMELGSNSPLIVLDDADLEKVATATVATGFANAGQVCISCQRVIATPGIHDNLLDELQPRVAAHTAGDQLAEDTKVGPLVRQGDAERVAEWIGEAASSGARLLCGGERSGSVVQPALLADVQPSMRLSCDELFGPAVGVTRAANIDEAIKLANDTPYGLSAGIFTENLDAALRFAREVESGNLHINWGPMWRADLMPYGGLKDSGLGKEGPKYAIEEMTETKMVVIHGK
jgi:glyceraldehyde-3-phosphate dehydrogenase (NADP+)